MSLKKKMLAVAAVGALTAVTAIPALALENEFHGMYKFMGYQSNFINGAGQGLSADPHSGFFAEQRARLLYTAKANDNLKLVTHFELDTRFGGTTPDTYKGAGNDSGNLDADQLTLETKNVYLDFNALDTNFKTGIQSWADSYKSLFLLADMTGVYATKKFDPLTASLGWFRFDDNTPSGTRDVGQLTADLIVVDGKFAINKDLTIGANYYNIQNDTGTGAVELLHMFGANASAKFGPAAIDAFAGYQMGDATGSQDVSAFILGTTGKVKVGTTGAVNFAAIYLSGDDNAAATTDTKGFQTVSANTTYFNPANMWLLVRSGQATNTSTSVLGNDLTVGGRGLIGLFAGYEGTVDKLFYNANVGYAQTADDRGTEESALGTEVNAQVGYKLYDNLSVSVAGAYLFLGDGLGGSATERINGFGVTDADDVYLANVQVAYTF